jgi:CRP/FNR family transcriptional regulator
MTEEVLLALDKIPFFQGISSAAATAVAERMVPRTVSAGTILFRSGDEARGVYILLDGEIDIYRTGVDGRQQIIHTEHPVKPIAELPMLDGQPYPASGRASVNSRLLFLSADDFRRLYREHPEIADRIIRILGKRLRNLIHLVDKVSMRDVPQRVAMAILDCAREAGQLRPGGQFRMVRTQAQLAAELATSRETVARALKRFRSEGWIEQQGRDVVLADPSALEALVHGR